MEGRYAAKEAYSHHSILLPQLLGAPPGASPGRPGPLPGEPHRRPSLHVTCSVYCSLKSSRAKGRRPKNFTSSILQTVGKTCRDTLASWNEVMKRHTAFRAPKSCRRNIDT